MDKLAKLMKKKKGSSDDMSDNERNAKMSQLHSLSDMAGGAMADRLKSLKTASVMSDSKEGLKHGLDKAKQILGAGHDGYNENASAPHHNLFGEGTAEEEAAESPEEEAKEEADGSDADADEMQAHIDKANSDGSKAGHMDSHELDAHIEHLKKLQAKKKHLGE